MLTYVTFSMFMDMQCLIVSVAKLARCMGFLLLIQENEHFEFVDSTTWKYFFFGLKSWNTVRCAMWNFFHCSLFLGQGHRDGLMTSSFFHSFAREVLLLEVLQFPKPPQFEFLTELKSTILPYFSRFSHLSLASSLSSPLCRSRGMGTRKDYTYLQS